MSVFFVGLGLYTKGSDGFNVHDLVLGDLSYDEYEERIEEVDGKD